MPRPLPLTLCLSISLALLAGCERKAETAERPPLVRPVKLVEVTRTSNEFELSFPAIVEAAQSSQLTFQVRGLVKELPVVEGQVVAKDDLIAKLDDRDYQSRYISAKATYENADAEYKRAIKLADQNAIAAKVLDQRRTDREIKRANLATAEKALDDTALRAPFAGQIASVNIEAFQTVQPQQTVVTLQSVGTAEAVVDVPARLFALGSQIEAVGTIVTLDAAQNVEIPAQLKEFSGKADQATQTYRARFTFTPPPELTILPGMTGTVDSTLLYNGQDLDLGFAVPLGAILAEGDDLFVWVVDNDTMTVSKRQIEISQERVGNEVSVVSGLEGGETIAAAGVSYLHDGMQVRAWQP